MDNRLYWVWLHQALTPGNPLSAALLRQFEDARAIYEADRKTLEKAGASKGVLARLCDKTLDPAKRVLEAALKGDGWLLTPEDACFPDPLRGIYAPPVLLFGKGTLPVVEEELCMAIVGTRRASSYGLSVASRLAAGLAAGGMTVVSGGARGIDGASHNAAMDVGGRTIGIQACGLDVDYPQQNASMRQRILQSGGMLLSEYSPGTPPFKQNFQIRNRLISGISLGVCVVEAPLRSGALITARLAGEQGKDVFAVPGAVTSPLSGGTNRLIKGGAHLIKDASDVLEEYRLRFGYRLDIEGARQAEQTQKERETEKFSPPISAPTVPAEPKKPSERPAPVFDPDKESETVCRVYSFLNETPQPVDLLSEQTGLSPATVLAALTELEIEGCVVGTGGQNYRRG